MTHPSSYGEFVFACARSAAWRRNAEQEAVRAYLRGACDLGVALQAIADRHLAFEDAAWAAFEAGGPLPEPDTTPMGVARPQAGLVGPSARGARLSPAAAASARRPQETPVAREAPTTPSSAPAVPPAQQGPATSRPAPPPASKAIAGASSARSARSARRS